MWIYFVVVPILSGIFLLLMLNAIVILTQWSRLKKLIYLQRRSSHFTYVGRNRNNESFFFWYDFSQNEFHYFRSRHTDEWVGFSPNLIYHGPNSFHVFCTALTIHDKWYWISFSDWYFKPLYETLIQQMRDKERNHPSEPKSLDEINALINHQIVYQKRSSAIKDMLQQS